MNLRRLYQGPTDLKLDEYATLPAWSEHGDFLRVGAILGAPPKGLSAEFWECRMPSRFYKAVIVRPDGIALGTFATGSGETAGALLVDVCRALGTGFANLAEGSPGQGKPIAEGQVQITEPNSAVAVLTSPDTGLLCRVRAAVTEGLLTFDVADGGFPPCK